MKKRFTEWHKKYSYFRPLILIILFGLIFNNFYQIPQKPKQANQNFFDNISSKASNSKVNLAEVVKKTHAAEGDLTWSVTNNPTTGVDAAYKVTIDSTGIYVVGMDNILGSSRWKIEKRNLTDGSLIWSQVSASGNFATGVTIDSTGIYIVGYDYTLGIGNAQWRIEKRNLTTGSLIWSQVSNPSTYSDGPQGVTIDNTGIYVVGTDQDLAADQWRIEKRNLATGSLIWSQVSNPSVGYDVPEGVTIDNTGIYVVGYDYTPGNNQWRIEKRNLATGSLIWSQVSNPSASHDGAYGAAIDGTGIYVVGTDNLPGPSDTQWRIEKRDKANGGQLWSKTFNPSANIDVAYGVAVDSSGIYVVGTDYTPGNNQWRIEKRNLAEGNLTWSQVSNPSVGSDVAYGVTIDNTGIYVVGYDYTPGDSQWRIEKRESVALPLLPASSRKVKVIIEWTEPGKTTPSKVELKTILKDIK